MTAILAAIVAYQAGRLDDPPAITLGEAACVAEWFFRCVEVQPRPQITGITYQARPDYTFGAVPRYHVRATPAGGNPYDVQIDANSGQVLFVSNLRGGVQLGHPPKADTDRWLQRLGLDQGLSYDPQLSRYNIEVGGVPLCNLNGDSHAEFMTDHGLFAWYMSPTTPPAPPTGQPTITKAQAEAMAIEDRKQTVPNWPLKLETHTEPAIFFDDQTGKAKAAWRVEEGSVLNGTFHESWTHYVDAESGTIIPSDRQARSRLNYRSGPARSGLAHVPLSSSIQRSLQTVARKMRELGVTVSDPLSLSIGPTMEVAYDGVRVTTNSDGDLLSLEAPRVSGQMPDVKALEFGKKVILSQHQQLPEGKFELENNTGRIDSLVKYVQTAFGYPYLDSMLAAVEFDQGGTVSSFRLSAPSARPASPPGTILEPEVIKSKALELAKLDAIPGSTVRNAGIAGLGWWAPQGADRVRLVYRVSVGIETASDFSARLFIWSGVFDAQTGERLKN